MLRINIHTAARPNTINNQVLAAYLDSLKTRGPHLPAMTVHDLPVEICASIRGCTCRVRTDPKTGTTWRTTTIRFRDRRIPMMKYTTYIRAK
jgi:hypothetical protein